MNSEYQTPPPILTLLYDSFSQFQKYCYEG